MSDPKKWKNKNRNFEEEILNFLKHMPSGQTITDIANGIDSTRITVSKYITGLEKEEKIFTKKIGAYTLYFSSERSFVPRNVAMSFYEGILAWMKERIKDDENYKELGHSIAKFIPIPIGSYQANLLPSKNVSIGNFLKYYGNLFTYYDFLFDEKLTVEVLVDNTGTSAIYKLINIEILEKSVNFEKHFYIMSGIIESLISKWLKRATICSVDFIDIKNKIVQISLKVLES
jgi:hypothetical protein